MNISPVRLALLLIALVLACFALSPLAWAVDPPPDGGYPNFNTAEGEDALFSLTTGSNNTGIGFNALFNNTSGSDNTATGTVALYSNTTGSSNTVNGDSALFYNTTGAQNTAIGFQALLFNRTGNDNTANGVLALDLNNDLFRTVCGADRALMNTRLVGVSKLVVHPLVDAV